MGNCATNCSNCMGKDGEHSEFNMDGQSMQLQRQGFRDDGAIGLDGNTALGNRDVNKLLQSKMKFIIKLQAFWRGHTARRLISMLRAKQLGSSKYFT